MKNKFYLLILLVVTTKVLAQNTYKGYWDLVLKNDNKEAIKLIEKDREKNTVEDLLAYEIIRNQNGLINGASNGFLDEFIKHKDYEYYLYALWNEPFLFDNYLKTGFHSKNSLAIDKISKTDIEGSYTIKYALSYLNAVLKRDSKNFKDYYSIVNSIPVIKDWKFCGVFENLNKSGLDIDYGPEIYAKDDKVFNANSNGEIKWYTPHSGYTKEPYQFFTNHIEYGYGVNYAQTFIKSNENKRVQVRIGNSGAFKVWLNDIIIYENAKDVNTDLDAYIVEVNLQKGNNRLLIKNAESNSVSYFIVRVSDIEGKPIPDLTYSNTYSNYHNSSEEEINPVKKEHEVESFFRKKLENDKDNFLYKYCLIYTYIRNQKYEEANLLINTVVKDYRKSTLMRILQTLTNNYEENYTGVKEIVKNILLDDADSYFALVTKGSDMQELSRMSLPDLEKFVEKYKKATDLPILKHIAQFVLNARNEDFNGMKNTMELINESASDRVNMLQRFIPLFDQVFQNQKRSIKEYEKVLKERVSVGLLNGLINYYNKLDKKEEVLKLKKEYCNFFPYDNEFLFSLVESLHEYRKFEESLPYIDIMLENYPYSFKAMEYKGDALLQLNKKEEAISYYKKSLLYNNTNSKLITKIETLTRGVNLIEKYLEKDIYKYVEFNRNKFTDNNFGANILLDNRVSQLYENGTLKIRTVYLYEITASKGVEDYKEINLNLSGNYSVIKSEIIKPNKSIVPSEKLGSKFVFNNLEIGDVIYIEYETISTGSGRFYKDFVDFYQFDSSDFCLKTKYCLLIPESVTFSSKVANGEVVYKKSNVDNYDIHEWELISAKELPEGESYMPSVSDYSRVLHISSVNSWNDIANWYSDLVRPQSIIDTDVLKVYNEIFPEKNVLEVSENERAKRIYYYIMKNFNYSFVDFKQSGYIPQKPSKTIKTKLGDCKDFSTLYSVLARKAGLDVNLVLVLTSDYGKRSLILPSQDFNHCIVKVKINNEDQFLELTNKYLPFKGIPNSLIDAIALEIPYESENKVDKNIFHLSGIKKEKSKLLTDVKIVIDKDKRQNLSIDSKVSGSNSSSFYEILNQDKYDLIKKSIIEDFQYRIGENVVIDTLKNIKAEVGSKLASYETELHLDDQINEMGSMTFFKLPIVSHAYNKDIISEEKRNYPINYKNYEKTDYYLTKYEIEIPKGKKFIEIPENKTLVYKEHSYKVEFKKLSEIKLEVKIVATTSLENILKEEYKDFKEYVSKVLKAKDILIGYK